MVGKSNLFLKWNKEIFKAARGIKKISSDVISMTAILLLRNSRDRQFYELGHRNVLIGLIRYRGDAEFTAIIHVVATTLHNAHLQNRRKLTVRGEAKWRDGMAARVRSFRTLRFNR
ncbi:hypothetical protein PUN28_003839 [Cardiocondyla obscurior]|uniref:Uncharacterized protein n=1 Tax=Cardiocondyla obscurior TaxID=286306 RepID=A0AAW2GNE1_9HYME